MYDDQNEIWSTSSAIALDIRFHDVGRTEAVLTWLENLDYMIFERLNNTATYPIVAYPAYFLESNRLGAIVLMAGFWWFWFKFDKPRRSLILATFIGVIASIIAARLLAWSLPFRIRPMYALQALYHVPALPQGHGHSVPGQDWSSFPSDTAALFFALAYGLWRQSRIMGMAAFGFAIAAGCFARIALGVHYPLDSIVGGLIGTGCVAISCRVAAPRLTTFVGWFETDVRSHLYSLMFLLTCEMADEFDDVLQFMYGIRAALRSFGFDVGLIEVFGIALGVLVVLLTVGIGIMQGIQRVHAARHSRRL